MLKLVTFEFNPICRSPPHSKEEMQVNSVILNSQKNLTFPQNPPIQLEPLKTRTKNSSPCSLCLVQTVNFIHLTLPKLIQHCHQI